MAREMSTSHLRRLIRKIVNRRTPFLLVTIALFLTLLTPLAGQANDTIRSVLYCPACGQATTLGTKFCGGCGEKLEHAPAGTAEGTIPKTPLPGNVVDGADGALFTSGLELMERHEYALAVLCFQQVVEIYPDSEYVPHCVSLQEICRKLLDENAGETPRAVSGIESFFGGMLGGVVGIVALIAIIVALN